MCYIFSHLRQIIVVVLFSVLYIIQPALTITETNTMETWEGEKADSQSNLAKMPKTLSLFNR